MGTSKLWQRPEPSAKPGAGGTAAPGADSAASPSASGLPERLDTQLRSNGLLPAGSVIMVALSGGLDSVVLFDLLLGLAPSWGWQITAAHFDHRMRTESEAEASWVRDLCAAGGVACLVGRAHRVPQGEADARDLRYAFLVEARAKLDSHLLVTAHQADDQAETVLFRLLRGAGLRGLAGIPAQRPPGIARPLLPFWRSEIAEHAELRRLAYLSDPSNRNLAITRNWLRHRLIPALEARQGPGVRRELVRLGDLAGRAVSAVSHRVDEAVSRLELEATESRIVVARTSLRAYDNPVRAHLLRALVARVGPRPGRVGTRLALEFINTGSSGRQIELTGGVTLRREFDRLIIERSAAGVAEPDRDLMIAGGSGVGAVRVGGVDWRVRWSTGDAVDAVGSDEDVARFESSAVEYPLVVRGWRDGDRIRTPVGTRKLKKVFGDRKVACSERRRLPLVTDRAGVLWVVGLVQASRAAPRDGGASLTIRFRRES